MPKQTSFTPKFVEFIPDALEEGFLYISVRYKTACHRCGCGCGEKVVTPLTPTGWRMTYDGRTVSLHPSIGNWKLACQSHYWIANNRVRWASRWSPHQIEEGFAYDKQLKESYYKTQKISPDSSKAIPSDTSSGEGFWKRLGGWFLGR
jgi:hypothetical protein